MANTAAMLSAYLACKTEINLLTLQETRWTAKYESNAAMLAKHQKQEEKWWEAYDKCMEGKNDGTEGVTHNGRTFNPDDKNAATNYANLLVCEYCELDERLIELTDLDTEYSSMKEVLEVSLTEKRAYADSLKGVVQNGAQETGMISGK